MIRVELLHYTPIDIAAKAVLTCTGNQEKLENYNVEEFLNRVVNQGHESTIEHINYNFFIYGLSRSCLQELARHRHLSLSVKSTRWVLPKFLNTPVDEIFPKFNDGSDWQKELNDKYKEVMDLIYKIKTEKGVANDQLKYYLPEATPCELMLSCNARELRHIFELRTSTRALKESQDLCREMYNTIPEDHKFLYLKYFC